MKPSCTAFRRAILLVLLLLGLCLPAGPSDARKRAKAPISRRPPRASSTM